MLGTPSPCVRRERGETETANPISGYAAGKGEHRLTMESNHLRGLLDALPLYSEEEDLREEIPESELLERLPGEAGAATISLVRRLFEACSLLDARSLRHGKWAFVSFPASLAGHSLLHTLSTPGQSLFESDYWRQGGLNVEEQRQFLHQIETRRVALHPTKSAQPVRYVFVAWALIRLGNNFLLHHREDKTRTEEKNYVFPGGRVKPCDLDLECQTPEGLRSFHSSRSAVAMEALPATLRREIREETALAEGEDYDAVPRIALDPYRQVNGAGNGHAYTEYSISLFDVRLTPAGEVKLLAACDEKLAWFTIQDLLAPTGRVDGKAAFVDALKSHLGEGLADFLEGTPSSSTLRFRYASRADAVELPVEPGQPVAVGETGKEKLINAGVSGDELSMLLLSASLAKGIAVNAADQHVRVFQGGWLKAESEIARATLKGLAAKLFECGLPILDLVRDSTFRLSVAPDVLFFRDAAFSYRLSNEGAQGNGILEFELKIPPSPFFEEISARQSISLKSSMVKSLEAIAGGGVGPGGLEKVGYTDETLKKNFKEMIDDRAKLLGLRKMVRQSQKTYKISIGRTAA